MKRPIGNPQPREGYVLLAVLIVIVVLSLSAYQFTESMTAEYGASVRATEAAQARAFALSGLNFAAAALADPNTLSTRLGGNPFDNESALSNVVVKQGDHPRQEGRFALVAVVDTGTSETPNYQTKYGVTDESGRVNINALIQLDPSGNTLYNVLMALPPLANNPNGAQIADSIVDWVDTDDNPRPSGAESSYYSGLNPAYQTKNGPINSLDELLLVQGVTPQVLYGNDRNRNGQADDTADGSQQSLDRGLADYLTPFGRELNIDSTGVARLYINDTSNLPQLYQNLQASVGQPMADYVMGYLLYGGSSTGSSSSSSSGSSSNRGITSPTRWNLLSRARLCQAGGRAGGAAGSGSGSSGSGSGSGTGGAGSGSSGASGGGSSGRGAAAGGSPAGGAVSGAAGMSGAGAAGGKGASNAGGGNSAGGSMSGAKAPSTPAASGGKPSGMGGGGAGGSGNSSAPAASKTVTGTAQDLSTAIAATMAGTNPKAQGQLKSIIQLINSQITLPKAKNAPANAPTIVVPSPLNDVGTLSVQLPVLLDKLTTTQGMELIPRINVNTAPPGVLLALTAIGSSSSSQSGNSSSSSTASASSSATASPGSSTSTTGGSSSGRASGGILGQQDVDNILSARQGLSPTDPATMTGAWLLTQNVIKPSAFQKLQPYLTGRSSVYRVQALGYFGEGGPVARLEAVVDTSQGAPRFLSFRDLAEIDSPRGFEPPR